jgi:hypothetical protein
MELLESLSVIRIKWGPIRNLEDNFGEDATQS